MAFRLAGRHGAWSSCSAGKDSRACWSREQGAAEDVAGWAEGEHGWGDVVWLVAGICVLGLRRLGMVLLCERCVQCASSVGS